MISFRRFCKSGKLSIAPVIISSINDYTADTGSMSANPFGGRFYYHIGAMFERTEKISACSKCIINDQRQIIFACEGGNFFKIRNIESWITNGFQVDGLGIFINMRFKTFCIIAICKAGFDTSFLSVTLNWL